jgi:NhaA family Na+:H+ antiporter
MVANILRATFRSERYAAIVLALAAVAGLLIANSAAGPDVIEFFHLHFSPGFAAIDLSYAHWVTDGLLAIFFFIVAVELRQEFTVGELNSPSKALAPAAAALGGVLVPALIYFTIAGASEPRGWPIPTATDIAFALGLIALLGRNLPRRIRVFLMALAVLDDLVAILIIAIGFTASVSFGALFIAAIGLLFLWQACRPNMIPVLRPILLIALSLIIWAFVLFSGVHATIAGVAIGLVMKPEQAQKAAHALMPWSNAVILPLFAFVSALVVFPQVRLYQLDVAFWAIVIALPLGKLIGVTVAGTLVSRFTPQGSGLRGWDLIVVAAVAGIGFTVSLLMNELAFAGNAQLRDQGVLAVLTGSAISIIVGGTLVAWRARLAGIRH